MSEEPGAAPFRPRTQPSRLAVTVILAALAAATAWLWWDLRQVAEKEAALERRLGDDLQALQQRGTALVAQDEAINRQLGEITARHGEMSTRLDALYGARRAGLLAAEAEHLARLAAQRLALAQDPAGALALLTAADGALRDIRDADTSDARAAVARDLARLRDASAADTDALYLRLAALPDAVDAIAGRHAGAQAPKATPLPAAAGTPPASWWDRFTGTLSALVTVRRVDAPLTPMVTEGERALATQNFRLLVEQAQIALLQRRGTIYRHSLAQADRWLARISAGNPAQRNAVHRELASLQASGPTDSLPDLSGSLTATRTLAARLLPEGAP